MSAIRHAAAPVLLVNCEPTDASTAHFDHLAAHHPFDVLDAPLRQHGAALDVLVPACRAEFVLLLDSDAEIRTPTIVPELLGRFERKAAIFGSGWYWIPKWLDEAQTLLLHEVPWMPCVAFRVEHVRRAAAAGASFRSRSIYNDVAVSQRLGRLLAARFDDGYTRQYAAFDKLPTGVKRRLRGTPLPRLTWMRRTYHGQRPNVVWCDTGAGIYRWAKEQMLVFAGLPTSEIRDDVVHYGGLTRAALTAGQAGRPGYDDVDHVESVITQRLIEDYGVDLPLAYRRVSPGRGVSPT